MNYRDSILSYLQKIENTWNELTELDLTLLSDHIQIENVKKNKYLLNAGEICKYIYVIQTGSAWKFHVIKGKKIPTEFAFKDDILIPFQSYYLQTPSHEYIQVMENSIIEKIEYGKFESLKVKSNVLQKLDNLFLELHILKLEERLYSLRFHTAKEKIEWLLHRDPELFKKVASKHIASYLDIRIETLIRERKKIFSL
jgi:signal-transduction protein with cAMP-binding, CBS, and nucleotidyltransferase domain